ncbi:MAG TPA: zinc ribbon domain-containing protein [Pyrinomonadaceae bacterium]|nr:zinc ribbon domain-containing protein [Pyrinomonadaceae bacterium]
MVALRCHACGSELLPEAKFCRRCGLAVDDTANDRSELPTALLSESDSATTQRLQPRITGRATASKVKPNRRKLLIIGVVLLLLIGLAAATALFLKRNERLENSQLIYPGARTVLDMRQGDGGRTLHLQTRDSLDQVEKWYQSNLKLTKTTRLTANSYVLKGDAATITLVVEDNTTNILIKQSP